MGLSRGAPETPAAGEWDAAADAAITAAAKAKDQQKDLGETLPSWVVSSNTAGCPTAGKPRTGVNMRLRVHPAR